MKTDMLIELVVFQAEGINPVFDRLEKLNIKSISITPFFFEETGDTSDLRLPPLDLDGQARELDRPLQNNERVKYGKRFLLFSPDDSLYGSSPYRPLWKEREDDLCAEVIAEGKKRGCKINMILPAPAGIKPEDAPRDVYSKPHFPKISNKGCINNQRIIDSYTGALKDILKHYKPDGINVDWIEYTNYFFTDNLVCFCDSCKKVMVEEGFVYDFLKSAARSAYEWIEKLEKIPNLENADWNSLWTRMSPGITELFRFKAVSCGRLINCLKKTLEERNAPQIQLIFPGFAPPMNRGTGFHYNYLAESAENIQIQPKGYRFHWGLMVKWYAEELAAMNKKIPMEQWIPFAEKLLEVSEGSSLTPEDYRMPAPDEFGPISPEREFEKLTEAWNSFEDKSKAAFRLHAYGPVSLFEKRLDYAKKGPYENIHIQRYGYTADDKLDKML